MNPKVSSSCSMNGTDMNSLQTALHETTGMFFGYMPHDMADTQIISFTLTLCGKKKMSKQIQAIADATIRAWGIGRGFGLLRISWPNLYN